MFFKEYKDYMLDLAQGYIRELYIITDHFYDLTGDGSMFSIIESAIKHSKVYIGFMDKGKNNFIKIIKENCGKSKNLYLSKYDNIKHTKIIVNNDYMITIYYKPIKVNNNVILEEVSMLTYNKEEIDMEIKHLKIKFEQDLQNK